MNHKPLKRCRVRLLGPVSSRHAVNQHGPSLWKVPHRRVAVGALPSKPAGDGPERATRWAMMGPMVHMALERVEALELLGMTLAHLNIAEASGEMSPRVPLLMAVRDKLAAALREET